MGKKLLAMMAAMMIATVGAGSAQAGITFAFENNSATTDPLFTLSGSSLTADNNVDLTIDINGTAANHSGVDFDFDASVVSTMVIPFVGTIYTFEDVTFSFVSGNSLVVSGAAPGALMFLPANQTAAALMFSSPNGDVYTEGPVLRADLDAMGLQMFEMGGNQDFSFAFAGLQTTQEGWTVGSSYIGTSDLVNIVPEPASISMLALAGLGLIRRKRSA